MVAGSTRLKCSLWSSSNVGRSSHDALRQNDLTRQGMQGAGGRGVAPSHPASLGKDAAVLAGPSVHYVRHCAWELAASGWSFPITSPRRSFIEFPTTVDNPLNTTPAFLRPRNQQGWLPYQPQRGLSPRSPGKPSSNGRYRTSRLHARGSLSFEFRVEGKPTKPPSTAAQVSS